MNSIKLQSNCNELKHFSGFDSAGTGSAHPAAIASTTWAVARLRLQLPAGFASEVLCQMAPQDASLTLWALAKLRHNLPSLRVKADRTWSTRDASTAMWACATMQTKSPKSVEIWCNALLEKMHLCTQQVGTKLENVGNIGQQWQHHQTCVGILHHSTVSF